MKRFLITLLAISTFSLSHSQLREVDDSGFRMKIGGGYSHNFYHKYTSDWLGKFRSMNLFMTFGYDNYNLNLLFKPMSINPQMELEFDGKVLPLEAKLNPIKSEVNIGYELNLRYNFRTEPYLGYVGHSFTVINEDMLGESFDIKTARGLTIGVNLFKYIKLRGSSSIGGFINCNYNLINFRKVNSELNNNFFAFSYGLLFMMN